MENLNKLIDEYDWSLISWRERYGNGVWVVIGPVANYIYQIQEIKDGADIESLELGYYFGNEGSWLPAVYESDLNSAVIKLENKVKEMADNHRWRKAVYEAFESILEENDGNYGLKVAVEKKTPQLMKPNF